METVNIKMLKMYNDVKLPSKTVENAGYDIYANFEEDYIIIMPHESKLIPTGFKTVIPPTHYAQIFERGSSGVRNLKFNAGVIDSGFRGEWKVCLYNGNDVPVVIAKNSYDCSDIHFIYYENFIVYPYEKAIAQFVVLPVPNTTIEEVTEEEFNQYTSERGEGMLGSSNK